MKQLFNETIQKLRILIFGYLDAISEETTRSIYLGFKAFSKNKCKYKWSVWFFKIHM